MSQRFNTKRGSRRSGERGATLVEMAVSTLTFYSIILYSVGVVLIMNEASVVTQQVVIGSFNGVTDSAVSTPAAADLFNPPIADAEEKLGEVNIDADKAILYKQANAVFGPVNPTVVATTAVGADVPEGYSKAQSASIDDSSAEHNITTLETKLKIPFLAIFGASDTMVFTATAFGKKPNEQNGETVGSCVAKGLSKNAIC